MKLTYDSKLNVAYISFKEKTVQVKTVQVNDDLLVDIAPDGTVYGIELLNESEQLGADHEGKLIVVNEILGETAEVKLAL